MPCLAMRGAILSNYETRVVNIRTSEVQTQLRILANHLLTYEYLRNPSSSIVDAELEQFSSFYDGRVLVIDGSLRVVKDTYDMSKGKTVVSGDVVRCLQNGSRAITGRYVKNDRYLEVIVPISETKALENKDFSGNGSSSEEVSGVLLASVSTDSIAATLEVLGRKANLLMLFMVHLKKGIRKNLHAGHRRLQLMRNVSRKLTADFLRGSACRYIHNQQYKALIGDSAAVELVVAAAAVDYNASLALLLNLGKKLPNFVAVINHVKAFAHKLLLFLTEKFHHAFIN